MANWDAVEAQKTIRIDFITHLARETCLLFSYRNMLFWKTVHYLHLPLLTKVTKDPSWTADFSVHVPVANRYAIIRRKKMGMAKHIAVDPSNWND